LNDIRQTEANVAKHINPASTEADANFLGWQKTLSGEYFPLFNITLKSHPLYQSTVSDATLRKLKLRIPGTSSTYPEIRPVTWNNPAIELNYPKKLCAERRGSMNKSMFREIKEGEDVTDIITRVFVFMAIPAAVFVIAVALWTALLR
jgi:hypothetical protein